MDVKTFYQISFVLALFRRVMNMTLGNDTNLLVSLLINIMENKKNDIALTETHFIAFIIFDFFFFSLVRGRKGRVQK